MNRRDRLLRQLHFQRFVVTMLSGQTFDGLLGDADDNTVKLVGAFEILNATDHISVDGDMYLPREKIAHMQNPGGRP